MKPLRRLGYGRTEGICHFCQYRRIGKKCYNAAPRIVLLHGAAMVASLKSVREDHTFVRVLLADDSPSMLQAARRILEPEFHVVGTVDDGQAVFEATEILKPDVLVLDISMGMMNGLEAARLLTQHGSKAKIVFLTVHKDQEFLEEAFSAGAVGYVIKPRLGTDLLVAVREALVGHTFISPDLMS